MASPFQSLLATGTKLWLSSIDPEAVKRCQALGITGATFGVAELVALFKANHCDHLLMDALASGIPEDSLPWHLMDVLAGQAQANFFPVWEKTQGEDGYVSFAPNSLIEDPQTNHLLAERTAMYVAQGLEWCAGHSNRMIQVPATPAGLAALEPLAAAGVPINVTCVFSERQYLTARDAIWRGMQRRSVRATCKSVFTVSPGRIDDGSEHHFPHFPGRENVGILLAQHIWSLNQQFWTGKGLPLKQDILFAETRTLPSGSSSDRYTDSLTGPGIQVHSSETYDSIGTSGKTFVRRLTKPLVPSDIVQLRSTLDWQKLERLLLTESVCLASDLQNAFLSLVTFKCQFFRRFGSRSAKISH